MDGLDFLNVFLPTTVEGIRRLETKQTVYFAHYTSATNAHRILGEKKITLRNALLMNDFSEIEHGERCLGYSLSRQGGSGSQRDKLAKILDSVYSDTFEKVENRISEDRFTRRNMTYLLSLAEYDEEEEKNHGKLSMWRAYGGPTNVALLVDPRPIMRAESEGTITVPVTYRDPPDFLHHVFAPFCDGLESATDYLRTMSPDEIVEAMVLAMTVFALTTKHPGFAEEKEWRIIYSPVFGSDPHIETAVTTIQDVPQTIVRMSLDEDSESTPSWRSVKALLKKIVIGPTSVPFVLFDAFVEILAKLDIPEPENKVVFSDIPIRR